MHVRLYVRGGAALMGIPGSLDIDRVARSIVKRSGLPTLCGRWALYKPLYFHFLLVLNNNNNSYYYSEIIMRIKCEPLT